VKLHNGVTIPARVLSKAAEFAPNERWLSSLSAVVEAACAKWKIELEPVAADTWMSLVLFGNSPALGPVVIKSMPRAADFAAHARALEIGASDVVPRLYDVDFNHCTMVMERIVPGIALRDVEMDDATSTRVAAETVRLFWRPASHTQDLKPQRRVLQPLFDWTPRPKVLDAHLVAQAQQLAASLLQRSARSCLLHGDVHHWNVLQRASGEWAVIDPGGHVGDPASEIARWMHNPPEVTEREDFLDVAARRLAVWADVTGIDEDHLASWALVGNVLNAINCTAFAPEVTQTCVRVAQRLQTFVRR
jgi:streptomycin 6-kinase